MPSLYSLLAFVPVSIAFRYLIEESQAARLIGMKLASPEFLRSNPNGFQDAVSIPARNKWFLFLLLLLVGGLAWLAIGFGWRWALGGLVVSVVSSTVAQVIFLPKKESPHFLARHARSMRRRHREFERAGENARAMAMQHLLERLSSQYDPP